eukprot:1756944-Pleurochrysis_carterae.AAC.2
MPQRRSGGRSGPRAPRACEGRENGGRGAPDEAREEERRVEAPKGAERATEQRHQDRHKQQQASKMAVIHLALENVFLRSKRHSERGCNRRLKRAETKARLAATRTLAPTRAAQP